MATIREVAERAGVSISTVSLAFNRPDKVSERTVRKVMMAAAASGYVANPIAKSLRTGNSPLIGLVVSSVRTAFAESFLAELETNAFEHGFLTSFSDSSHATGSEGIAIDRLIAIRARGIVLQDVQNDPTKIDKLQASGMPVLLIDQNIPHSGYDTITLDNRLAIGILTRHLIGHGHRRLGYISGTPGLWTTCEREAGFEKAIETAALSPDDVSIVPGNYTLAGGHEAATRLLLSDNPPTGIIAANHEMLLGTLKAAHELGFQIPQELSVCCVDSAPWSEIMKPSITHVKQPISDMAALGAQWLIERIEHPDRNTPARQKVFVPEFVVGQSTAAAPV